MMVDGRLGFQIASIWNTINTIIAIPTRIFFSYLRMDDLDGIYIVYSILICASSANNIPLWNIPLLPAACAALCALCAGPPVGCSQVSKLKLK